MTHFARHFWDWIPLIIPIGSTPSLRLSFYGHNPFVVTLLVEKGGLPDDGDCVDPICTKVGLEVNL